MPKLGAPKASYGFGFGRAKFNSDLSHHLHQWWHHPHQGPRGSNAQHHKLLRHADVQVREAASSSQKKSEEAEQTVQKLETSLAEARQQADASAAEISRYAPPVV